MNSLGQPDEPAVEDLLIAVCGPKAVVWLRAKDGKYKKNSPVLSVASLLNMHRMSFFHLAESNPPRWSEQQTYTLIAHSEGHAKLQWSRAVTNPLAAQDWPRRYFMGYGLADMQRNQETCDPYLSK